MGKIIDFFKGLTLNQQIGIGLIGLSTVGSIGVGIWNHVVVPLSRDAQIRKAKEALGYSKEEIKKNLNDHVHWTGENTFIVDPKGRVILTKHEYNCLCDETGQGYYRRNIDFSRIQIGFGERYFEPATDSNGGFYSMTEKNYEKFKCGDWDHFDEDIAA